jgi:hypothetical protein
VIVLVVDLSALTICCDENNGMYLYAAIGNEHSESTTSILEKNAIIDDYNLLVS